jgi:hypothetical protein
MAAAVAAVAADVAVAADGAAADVAVAVAAGAGDKLNSKRGTRL